MAILLGRLSSSYTCLETGIPPLNICGFERTQEAGVEVGIVGPKLVHGLVDRFLLLLLRLIQEAGLLALHEVEGGRFLLFELGIGLLELSI